MQISIRSKAEARQKQGRTKGAQHATFSLKEYEFLLAPANTAPYIFKIQEF